MERSRANTGQHTGPLAVKTEKNVIVLVLDRETVLDRERMMDTLYFKKDICTRADVRLDLCILFTLDTKISPLGE